jgi:hypothetical protein
VANWEISFDRVTRLEGDGWDLDLVAERDGRTRATYTCRATGPAIALVGRASLTAAFKRAWVESATTHLRGEIESGAWPGDGVPTATILDDASIRSIANTARGLTDAVAPAEGDLLVTFVV